jgi:hypothetical protein
MRFLDNVHAELDAANAVPRDAFGSVRLKKCL